MNNTSKLVPLVIHYSFDSEVPVYLFDSEEDAKKELKRQFDEELRIQTEENGHVLDEDIFTDVAEDWASITIYWDENKDVMEWAVGNIKSKTTGCDELPDIKETCDGFEISKSLPDGGKLVAYTGESDYDTPQAGIMYYDKEGNPLGLALAEVRRGELAVIDGKDPDNEDIDLIVWGDIYSDDYTEKITFTKDKIEDAFRS